MSEGRGQAGLALGGERERTAFWARPLSKIEARVADPGDSDTRRFQKVLVVVVSLVGSVATLFNAMPLFGGGLNSMGWAYVASAVVILAGALALLAWPRAYTVITLLLLLDVLVVSGIVQVLSGGITSGLAVIAWAIFAPLGAALALGPRHALALLVLFVVTIVTVALLQPLAETIAPEIPSDVVLRFNVPSLISLGAMAAATSLYLVRQVERFRGRADTLLLNVLPAPIASRLKGGATRIADRSESVTVLFADIVGFTPLSSQADPAEIVDMLNVLFSELDALASKHGVEKIKTIGDSYMAVTGLLRPQPDHTEKMIEFAQDVLNTVAHGVGLDGSPIRLRIGINTGPVVAGVIGRDRFIYDLWGDTVNVASRMEESALVDSIHVTQAVVDHVGNVYQFEPREPLNIRGKGTTVTYSLVPGAQLSSAGSDVADHKMNPEPQ